MKNNIEVTLTDGKRRVLRDKQKIEKCNKDKLISIIFDNSQIFNGYFVEIENEGEEPLFILHSPMRDSKSCIGLPYDRIVGWFYQ